MDSTNKEHFCERNYLDLRTMAEIANIKDQLSEIVKELGASIGSGGSDHRLSLCRFSADLSSSSAYVRLTASTEA